MKKKILILINSFMVFTFSCDNEEIAKQEATYPADEPTYKTEKGALEGLNTAYDILQLGEEVERIEFVGTVSSGDAMVGGEPGALSGGIPQSVGQFLMRTDWNERRIELAFEGHQFFDIVRTGRVEQILKNEAMQ